MSLDQDAKDRNPVMRDLNIEFARMLGSIPRLPGSLSTDASGPDTLIRLRLVLSKSELALLPFELTKIPIGPATWAEGGLSLQMRVSVIITRRTRDTPDSRLKWPTEPRVLFIAGDPDCDHLPLLPHHGSQNNIDQSVLDLVDCQNYLVSTNGSVFGHPDNEAIARVIQFGRYGTTRPRLWFNYESDENSASKDPGPQQKDAYDTVYPMAGSVDQG